MIYGDNPQKINEREDRLGLKSYSFAPQISAVLQSGNLYVYCGSNPVKYIDYTGYDAIWLQYKDGAGGFGHTGLLIQDDELDWHLFYWGASDTSWRKYISFVDSIADDKVLQNLGNSEYDLDNLENILKFITDSLNEKAAEDITGHIYMRGNFQKSIDYINSDLIGKKYNLWLRNCIQMSIKALCKGTFSTNDKGYKVALNDALRYFIPNNAYEFLCEEVNWK